MRKIEDVLLELLRRPTTRLSSALVQEDGSLLYGGATVTDFQQVGELPAAGLRVNVIKSDLTLLALGATGGSGAVVGGLAVVSDTPPDPNAPIFNQPVGLLWIKP